MYRWALFTGGAAFGGLVLLLDTTYVRAVLTGPPPGDLAGLGLSDRAPSGGVVPMEVALWVFLAVAAVVLVLGAVRSLVSRAAFRPDPAAAADSPPPTGDGAGR
ncbi:hypothetical protein AB0K00_24270 [Dactylosporangium sp. NPDC049525]|uniref:hypothetical protein n=1 Tax=Dactylosporangium sp. NPDC049525 TaxID=3154730 RepID=UPI003441FCDC